MAELDKFTESAPTGLDAFVIDSVAQTGLNKATAQQKASYSALLDEESSSLVETYSEIKGDLEATGVSYRANKILEEKKRQSIVTDQDALRGMIVDDDISFDEKKNAAINLIDRMNEQPNLRNELSLQAAIEPSAGENAEMEAVRIDTSARIKELNEIKRAKQGLVNNAMAQNDSSLMDTFVDFAEMLLPFTEQKRLATLVSDYKGEDETLDRAATFADIAFLTGSDKKDMINALKRMSPEEQLAASQNIVDMLNNSSEMLLPDENDLVRMDFLRTFVEDGYYTETDVWLDNVVNLLDYTVIGAPLARYVRGVKTATKPASVAQNVKDVNPAKAKAMHASAVADDSGEVADALYGTDRSDVIGADLGFEIAEQDGSVVNKVGNVGGDLDKEITPNGDSIEAATTDGAIYYWEDEKKQARSVVYNDFRNATGLRLRDEMASVGKDVDDGVVIKAIYGPTQGGFADAEDAVEAAKTSLRKYGITENNIQLMVQNGDHFTPITKQEAMSYKTAGVRPAGGFLAQVNYKYKINPLDIEEMSKADVKWNLFDKIAGSHTKDAGSLQRHLLDAHSMLHPNITMGATVAVDRAAGLEKNLLELGRNFTDKFSSLPKERQALLKDYVLEANDKGIEFNANRLVADGYNQEEIEALADWKTYWDTVYTLENKDLAKTLRGRGYQVMEDKTSDTRLFAKPVPKQVLSGSVEAYDVASDSIVRLNRQDLDDLYGSKGTVARLRDPINKNGDIAEYVVSKETSDNYLRGIGDSEQVLNYRKGYYSVQYTAPKYVVERVKDNSGKVVYERAVQMAGNTKDADLAAKRLAATKGGRYNNADPNADVFIRDNVKGHRIDSDDYWTMQTAGGRSAQRVRGQRLEDASGAPTVGDQEWVMGPVDSLINSARNISRRTSMRDYLEATKTRFLNQYKDVLPVDEFNQTRYPKNAKEIGREGRKGTRDSADARTTFEYIKSLEDGYINGMDEAYKAGLKLIGGILGDASTKTKGVAGKALSKAEEGLEVLAAKQGPTGFGKNIAFQSYLALAPMRQALVQAHQTVTLAGVNPTYMVGGQFARDMTSMSVYVIAKETAGETKALSLAAKISGKSKEEFAALQKAWELSGMGSAVDKQNLIRGSLSEMASYGKYGATQTATQKALSPATSLLNLSRKIGFDAGEYYNSLSSWLAYYNKVSSGKKGKMSQADFDEVTAKARNVALNMNQAGEMPYNQNALGLFFQFMQVPHKMVTTLTTNRVLSKKEKLGLAGLNFTLFGVGANAVYEIFDPLLPDDPDLRDAVSNGLEGYMVNRALTNLFEGGTRIDFSSLAPTDMYGLSEFMTQLWTENPGNIIAASPAGQLFFGNNPRITNAFKRAAQYFHLMPDSGDPVELSTVFQSFAQISSGYSAGFKAKMAYEYGLKRNSYGGIVDENVSKPEAIAQAFGFATLDERDLYLTGNKSYEKSKAFKEDFKLWYRDLKQRVAAEGVNPEDREFALRIMNAGLNAFQGDKTLFQTLLTQQLKYDVEVQKDYSLYQSALRSAGFMGNDERRKFIEALPFEDAEVKQQLLQILDHEEGDEG